MLKYRFGCISLLAGGYGVLQEIPGGSLLPGSLIPDPISTHHFPHLFSDDLEEFTKCKIHVYIGRNYAIFTRLGRQQKDFEFAYISLSYSFRIEMTNTFIHSHSSLPDSRPSGDKFSSCFQTETAQKPYPKGWLIPSIWVIIIMEYTWDYCRLLFNNLQYFLLFFSLLMPIFCTVS